MSIGKLRRRAFIIAIVSTLVVEIFGALFLLAQYQAGATDLMISTLGGFLLFPVLLFAIVAYMCPKVRVTETAVAVGRSLVPCSEILEIRWLPTSPRPGPNADLLLRTGRSVPLPAISKEEYDMLKSALAERNEHRHPSGAAQ